MKRNKFVRNDLGPGVEWCDVCKNTRLTEKNNYKGTCLRCAKELISGKIAEATREMMINGNAFISVDPAVSVSGIMAPIAVSGLTITGWDNVAYGNMPFITGSANQSAVGGLDSNRQNPPRPTLAVAEPPRRNESDALSEFMSYFPFTR